MEAKSRQTKSSTWVMKAVEMAAGKYYLPLSHRDHRSFCKGCKSMQTLAWLLWTVDGENPHKPTNPQSRPGTEPRTFL